MRALFVRSVVLGCLWISVAMSSGAPAQDQLLAKAARLFGNPLNAEHRAYPFNENYVIWLILDTRGELAEVDIGPKSYYSSEFPNAPLPASADRLSKIEYQEILTKISQLKDVGALRKGHESPVPSAFGPLNTDQFDNAFVDRILTDDQKPGEVKRFNLYFFEDEAGSPEQVRAVQGQPMVCLVGVWYYIKPEAESKIALGQWQSVRVAGPNLHGAEGCHRAMTLHDADGFIIENPQNEVILVAEPYHVRDLVGRVTVSDQPVADANVEVRSVKGKDVLRSKTDTDGNFRIPDAAEGEYKFKVSKDGFKALSGKIIVDRRAQTGHLSFGLHVGT